MTSEASGVRAPDDSFSELADRLVDTGMPWKTPAPTFAIPWATDSWLTSMRYRWRAANALASPAVWENPISSSATAAIADRRGVVADEREVRDLGGREPARHLADQRDAVRAEIEQRRGEQPARDEDERAGHRRRHPPQPEDHGERADADQQRRPVRRRRASRPTTPARAMRCRPRPTCR